MPNILSDNCCYRISAEEAINRVVRMREYFPGKENTIISLGCYSECMFHDNVKDTMEIIRYFSRKNNYIQLATKQNLSEAICQLIVDSRMFKEQINIYVSMPTYTKIPFWEPGTASLEERVHNIYLCKKYGINVVIYIKPYLENITMKDTEYYIDLVKEYNVPVVVGEYLSTEVSQISSEVGGGLLYEKNTTKEMERFIEKLSSYTTVYRHSTDYINDIRRKEKHGE